MSWRIHSVTVRLAPSLVIIKPVTHIGAGLARRLVGTLGDPQQTVRRFGWFGWNPQGLQPTGKKNGRTPSKTLGIKDVPRVTESPVGTDTTSSGSAPPHCNGHYFLRFSPSTSITMSGTQPTGVGTDLSMVTGETVAGQTAVPSKRTRLTVDGDTHQAKVAAALAKPLHVNQVLVHGAVE